MISLQFSCIVFRPYEMSINCWSHFAHFSKSVSPGSMVKTVPMTVASVKLAVSVTEQMVLVLMAVRMVTKNLSV